MTSNTPNAQSPASQTPLSLDASSTESAQRTGKFLALTLIAVGKFVLGIPQSSGSRSDYTLTN